MLLGLWGETKESERSTMNPKSAVSRLAASDSGSHQDILALALCLESLLEVWGLQRLGEAACREQRAVSSPCCGPNQLGGSPPALCPELQQTPPSSALWQQIVLLEGSKLIVTSSFKWLHVLQIWFISNLSGKQISEDLENNKGKTELISRAEDGLSAQVGQRASESAVTPAPPAAVIPAHLPPVPWLPARPLSCPLSEGHLRWPKLPPQ